MLAHAKNIKNGVSSKNTGVRSSHANNNNNNAGVGKTAASTINMSLVRNNSRLLDLDLNYIFKTFRLILSYYRCVIMVIICRSQNIRG